MFILMLLGAGSIVISELISWSAIFNAEINRKIFHLIACLLISSFVFFDLDIVAVTILMFTFLVIQILLKRYRPLTVLSRVKRKSYGEFYLLLGGIAAMAIANSWQAYFVAFLVLAVCDSLAAIVGQYAGMPDAIRFKNGKTLKGSGAFFISCALIIIGFANSQGISLGSHVLLYVITIAAALTLIELYLSKGLDNFAIPVMAVVLLDRIYA